MIVSIAQISDIVKMVGLVAGGLWVAWTFHKLQKVRAAELDNNQKLTAIQKLRIEQEEIGTRLLRQQPQLAIQLNVTETAAPTETCKSFLCVTVILKNEGERNLQIDFDTDTLTVGRMVFEKDGKETIDVKRYGTSYFAPDSNAPQFLPCRILRAGQQRQMALAILPVTEPGGYIVHFMPSTTRCHLRARNLPPKLHSSSTPRSRLFILQPGNLMSLQVLPNPSSCLEKPPIFATSLSVVAVCICL